MRSIIGITKKIFLESGRIVEVDLKGDISGNITKVIENGIKAHKCIAVENYDYETLVVLTRWSDIKIKDVGGTKHLVKLLTEKNYLGFNQEQYAVIRPIWRINKELVELRLHEPSIDYWEEYKERLFELLKGEINNQENIFQLSEVSKNIIGIS